MNMNVNMSYFILHCLLRSDRVCLEPRDCKHSPDLCVCDSSCCMRHTLRLEPLVLSHSCSAILKNLRTPKQPITHVQQVTAFASWGCASCSVFCMTRHDDAASQPSLAQPEVCCEPSKLACAGSAALMGERRSHGLDSCHGPADPCSSSGV